MKIIHQIFIIIFVATSLLIVKDDVIGVYHRSINYLGDKISTILIRNQSRLMNDEEQSGEIIELNKSVLGLPGALKVSNNFFIDNIKLSSDKIIEVTNKYRMENGNLKPLNENQKLNLSAEKKVQDMFIKQYFEHDSPEGLGVSDLADQVSYEYITVGENLATGGFKDDQALVDAWMDSLGHRENILNNHYTEIGVAVASGLFEGKKVWMAVQHFGIPKSECPKVDEVLHGVINFNEEKIKTMEEDLAIRRQMIENRAVYEGLSTNEQIDKYNSLIIIYNQLVSEFEKQIDNYNIQVRAFNSCLVDNTD